MSRRVQFRAWDKQRAQWFPMKNAMCLVINPTSTDLVFMTAQGPYPLPDTGQPDGGINRFVLEQFTGLQDAKGVDIYEGDILKCEGVPRIGFDDSYHTVYAAVIHNQATGGFRADRSIYGRWYDDAPRHFSRYEIAGNIHEHSHLLTAPTP